MFTLSPAEKEFGTFQTWWNLHAQAWAKSCLYSDLDIKMAKLLAEAAWKASKEYKNG